MMPLFEELFEDVGRNEARPSCYLVSNWTITETSWVYIPVSSTLVILLEGFEFKGQVRAIGSHKSYKFNLER
jgi:hypothetical protein